MKIFQRSWAMLLPSLLLLGFIPTRGLLYAAKTNGASAPQDAKQSPDELEQLVAPIALYPDALVSQTLAGATYPTEIVEAERWMQAHPKLRGKPLADEVNKRPWDPSIKALTQFPSVLANMNANLSWTSALGEAYVNQPEDVMNAVQVMRARAKAAGNLKSNDREKVETQGQTIVIEPANPDVVYVPAYDPWLVYGAPLVIWPDWYAYPGLYIAGPGISFGFGFPIGVFAHFGWGWHHWGCDWGHGAVVFNHATFISRSRTFYGGHAGFHDFGAARAYRGFHASRFHGGGFRGGGFRGGQVARGFSPPHAQPGLRSNAFSGFDHAGIVRSFSSRGRSSFGGGFHGGGFHGGGRR